MDDMLCYVVFVSQHKSVVDVSTKNKEASGVVVWKKCKFAEQQNGQVGSLPTVVAAHHNSSSLLENSLSRKEKVTVVNKIL